MGDAYRIAGVERDGDVRDWSKKFPTPHAVAVELHNRAMKPVHHGDGYRFRMRKPKEEFGPIRSGDELVPTAERRMAVAGFGDLLVCKAEKDNWRWFIRKIHDSDPPINLSEANPHIDYLYTYFFRDHRSDYPGIENWGTCNRRFIDGSTTWSEHSPWQGPNAGCNAIDIHASHDVMDNIFHRVAQLGGPHAAKALFYGREWTPQTGIINAPSIGHSHDDHVHVEGPRDHGGLASGCNY
jgi:hypothetical protein